jgi:hypothetical protein
VKNPSFEDDGGSFEDWLVDDKAGDIDPLVLPGVPATTHFARFLVDLTTVNPVGWIAQRLLVCPNTTYKPDFKFRWDADAANRAAVSTGCAVRFAWGQNPGDIAGASTTAFGTLMNPPSTTFVHVTSIAMPPTAANATSAFFHVIMDCTGVPIAKLLNTYMDVDVVLIPPP